MKKWLDKYEQGGLVLKKKTKDNFGKKNNPNDVQASVGPDFVGLGYNVKGRKYSPAWGGSFAAMGASIPGTVGFTYARTQNPAPANGKYTKKTLASAQKGATLDPELFNIDTTAAQDATRNVVPRKMTAVEKKDAIASANAARKRSQEKRDQIIAERTAKRQTKGDLNAPGTWNTAEKLRMFPNDIGGLGEIYDDYINPARTVGSIADMLGESIASRDAGGAAVALGLSAGLGALGMNPLGTALKYKNLGSNYIKNLQQQGVNVQTASMMGNPFRRTAAREFEEITPQASTQVNRVQQFAPYEPPTDAELLAMNQAEADRYFRRPAQSQQPAIDPDSFDWTVDPSLRRAGGQRGISQEQIDSYIDNIVVSDSQARSAAQAAQNDMRSQAASSPSGNNVIHRNNPRMTEDMLSRRQNALRTSGFTDAEIAADEAAIRRGEPLRTPTQIRGGVQGTFDLSRSRPQVPMKEWNPKEFRIGEGNEEGIIKMEHPEGHIIKQDVTRGAGADAMTYRNYEVSDKTKGSNYIKVETSQDPGDPFTDVNDISFFNRDPASSSKQMNIVFSHLPTKARIAPINTSIHSQPLLNARMAKLSSGQPGRIEIKPEYMGALNKITREQSGGPIHWYNEVIEQYPKLVKSNKTINEYTGANLQEPFIRYQGNKIPFEEFNTPEMKRLFENPQTYYDALNATDVMVNKYKTIKNWKNGGHFIDPMGQWAYPGEITTIPSNDITMRGVNYDVIGISNTGDKKLMKPGKNYKFDGDYVTEYPRGGWLEKYK
jgi:hypothetical protein